MKKILILMALLFCATSAKAATEAFTVFDSTSVNISTSQFTGATKILSASQNTSFVVLYATATGSITGERVFIADNSAVWVHPSTGAFQFPVNTMVELGFYKGNLWAIASGTTPINVHVFRKR